MDHKLRIPNDTTDNQEEVEIYFRVTRSTIESVRIVRQNPNGSFTDLPCDASLPGAGQLWVFFDPPLQERDAFWLIIEFSMGETPVVEDCRWNLLEEAQVTALPENRRPRPPAQLDFGMLFSSLDQVAARRLWRDFLAAEPDTTLRRFKEFFLELDRLTNPSLDFANDLPAEQKTSNAEMINKGRLRMDEQVAFRLESLVGGGPSYPALERYKESPPNVARFLSNFLLPFYRKYFPGNDHGLNQAEVAEAFCRFANGDLRTGDSMDFRPWNCEPDGAMLMHFANHALWSVLSEVDESPQWVILLPCFAAAQEFFMRAYHPDREPPYLQWWYAPWNYKHTPPLTPQAIEVVFSRYRGYSLQRISALMDENLRNMLTGNFPRSPSPPKRPITSEKPPGAISRPSA